MNLYTEQSNRLIDEKSPYLLEHAHNPVNWYPWGAEALNRALREDKPIFVSIGYSACHWCHVMAKESFEDESVASILNTFFIPVKVDREERPDIDAFCMKTCQIMTGSGGWPLSIFMTPDRKPFYAGTYFPKKTGYGRIGFIDLLSKIADLWSSQRDILLHSTQDILSALDQHQINTANTMDIQLIEQGIKTLQAEFDSQYGGFRSAPKFPTPHVLLFLLHYNDLSSNNQSLYMIEQSLYHMYMGGIFDHIGGGFSRYATDRKWLVPHFEKMLYDNALIALAYTETYALTQRFLYRKVACSTLDYVLREMRDEMSGFYAAQDADSEGGEGAYYLFTDKEIIEVLGKERGKYVCEYLNIDSEGNFEGKCIPNRLGTDMGKLNETMDEMLEANLNELYRYRQNRMSLRADKKILTAWNALMVIALARASCVFDRPDYQKAALEAIHFVQNHLMDDEGNVFIRWIDGERAYKGCLDDYAFLCWAFIALYDATLDYTYISYALSLCDKLIEKFGAGEKGGYWFGEDNDELAVRLKENGDHAIPSGNSVAGYVLYRLAIISGDLRLKALAHEQLSYIAGVSAAYPSEHAFGLITGMLSIHKTTEIVCATDNPDDADAFVKYITTGFHPSIVAYLNFIQPNSSSMPIKWLENCTMQNGRTTYYMCHDSACGLPVYDLSALPLNKIEK